MADMVKKSSKKAVTNEKIFDLLISMDERMADMKEGLGSLKRDVEEIKDVVKPLSKAFDEDSQKLMQHERRITVVEGKLGLPTR